ncbi:hypothetical protein DSAG12_02313 [Promethearchaeum syntrophicum]|uniref:Uncharacterized protein n=1 Tax=Promethearchaeum syntrophicum TaxID=2594042 RepID=A0A5B9DCK0_9ARCH|nr:hypothetical protein [Candidatus Prometheoarchaeum syntrophicum]QEE16483.1 hypothetical protein DSAG12_02313 [Candidatus Prometheoarchaeum syntrophicum]
MLRTQNKPIFYDFLLSLKNRAGKITDLVAIERIGGYERGYIETKDWDAGQLLADKMPMIYICNSPTEKMQILRNCQHIGKDFPLMTETEFKWFMIGLHNAYNDPIFDFSLENFVKSLFNEHPIDGKNWEVWGMTNKPNQMYASMIQGSFGIHWTGNYINDVPNYHFTWFYQKKKSTYNLATQYPFVNYNWGDRLQNNYWTFVQESLLESYNFNRKIYDQFFALKPDFVQISYPLPSPYPWMVSFHR